MQINPDTDALIVVDMQRDLTDPEGKFYIGGAKQIIPTINSIIEVFQNASATIIYTQDWHPKDSVQFESNGGSWPAHCIQDSEGAEINEAINVSEDATIIKKGAKRTYDGYSAFRDMDTVSNEVILTDVNDLLESNKIKRIFVCGVATEACVKNTAIDSAKSGYDTYVIENAIKPIRKTPEDEAEALQTMSANGAALVTVE